MLPTAGEADEGAGWAPGERSRPHRLVVECRLVEGPRQRTPRCRIDRRLVEPVDTLDWHRHVSHGPLARRTVAEQEARDARTGVLSRHDLVPAMPPDLSGSVGGWHGQRVDGLAPPSRLADGDRWKLEQLSFVSGTMPTEGVGHGQPTVDRGQHEATRVEIVGAQ